jgi:pimeloyl-ACP methyl ester carboxylesterase
MLRISNGVTASGGGETYSHAYRRSYRFDGTYRGVILCHGAGGDDKMLAGTFPGAARDALRSIVTTDGAGAPPNRYTVLSTLQSSGYVFPDEGDLLQVRKNSFGNANSSARVDEAYDLLTGSFGAKPGRVAVVGVSMGFLVACNWARANVSKVAGLIGVVPACDLAWFRGTDARHTETLDHVSINAPRTTLSFTNEQPPNYVANVNSSPPWHLVVLQGDDEVERRDIVSATNTTVTVSTPLGAGGPFGRKYQVRPRNDDGSGSVRDYGRMYKMINLVYPNWSGDVSFAQSVYPTRSPIAYGVGEAVFGRPCRLFVNDGDTAAPPARALALRDRWNQLNPGKCVVSSSGGGSSGHDDWTVSGQQLIDALEVLSW